ncbi:MAG: CotH kinase family protein [Clostridium sp.]|nr:CotH kinase family protein [Clostridium sp.]
MMSRRSVLICLIVLCGLIGFSLFIENNLYMELVFSKDSGFYEQPFELELHAPIGTKIYYTLDCSEPDENAMLYTEPILIKDATENDNVFSMITDVVGEKFGEPLVVKGKGQIPDLSYAVPNYNIDKCTVVRAAYLDADGNFSEIKTRSYFVGYAEKAGYSDINIISIVTNPDNLFDSDIGIYVVGSVYDGSDETVINYNQRGLDWERAANIELFDVERKMLLEQECGIRIQGNSTRGGASKGLKLYAREQYGGSKRFYADLFDTGYMADTVTLFTGGDDLISKLRDMLIAELVKDRNFVTMHFKPYAMFLNGEYWGVYWLTEKYDDVFLASYYDVDKDNVIMIKNRRIAEGSEEDYWNYDMMMQYMWNTDFSISENYENMSYIMDIQSLIDYYATEIYIGRYYDWPGNNFALWKVRKTGEKDYEDGKWRWMLFDVNSGGLSRDVVDMNNIDYIMGADGMFYNLCQNEDFSRLFVITFMDIANTCFTKKNVDLAISKYNDLMIEPIGVHNKRFYGSESYGQLYDVIADVQDFCDNRRPYILQYLKEEFGLTGTLAPVEVKINNAAAGNIIVNTAELTFDDEMTWSGEYFTDYSITLTAVANEGYHFVGWERDVTSDAEVIEIDIGEKGISVMAVFEEINS